MLDLYIVPTSSDYRIVAYYLYKRMSIYLGTVLQYIRVLAHVIINEILGIFGRQIESVIIIQCAGQ